MKNKLNYFSRWHSALELSHQEIPSPCCALPFSPFIIIIQETPLEASTKLPSPNKSRNQEAKKRLKSQNWVVISQPHFSFSSSHSSIFFSRTISDFLMFCQRLNFEFRWPISEIEVKFGFSSISGLGLFRSLLGFDWCVGFFFWGA